MKASQLKIPALCVGLASLMVAGAQGMSAKRFEGRETIEPKRFRTLEGGHVSLPREKGPTVLTFWATWCSQCADDVPRVNAFDTALTALEGPGFYPGESIKLYGVAIDSGTPEELEVESRALGVTYPVLMTNKESAHSFGVMTLPTTVVIDSRGGVLGRFPGALDVDLIEACLEGSSKL